MHIQHCCYREAAYRILQDFPNSAALYGRLVLIAGEDLPQVILLVVHHSPHPTVVDVCFTSGNLTNVPEYVYRYWAGQPSVLLHGARSLLHCKQTALLFFLIGSLFSTVSKSS